MGEVDGEVLGKEDVVIVGLAMGLEEGTVEGDKVYIGKLVINKLLGNSEGDEFSSIRLGTVDGRLGDGNTEGCGLGNEVGFKDGTNDEG